MTLDIVVLTAFHTDAFPTDELAPWLERHDWSDTVDLPAACGDYQSPLHHDGTVGVLATGVGPTAAATTVSALLSTAVVDDATRFLTAGIAGGPLELPVGSVVVGESVVDWDRKHRTDDGLELLDYRPRDYAYDLDDGLTSRVRSAVEGVSFEGEDTDVTSGTVVAGGEFWHGHDRAEEVAWLCDRYDVPPYRASVTEDAGTAHALARHGALDRYATLRAISNADRPTDGGGGIHSWEDGLALAVENAYRGAKNAVETVADDWP
jgi:purine nucleoside permease